jgi:3-hydroxyacyl-CoA dehydrogenase
MTEYSPEAARSMFILQGWTEFQELVEEQIESVSSIDTVTSEQEMWFAKGRLDALRFVAAYETTLKAVEDMEEDDASYI